MSALQMTEEREGSVLVFALAGRLDSGTAKDLEESLKQKLDSGEQVMLMDMEGLDYISSAGLRVVLLAAKRLRASDGRFGLSALKGEIRQVFEISGLLRILTVFDSRHEAVESLGS